LDSLVQADESQFFSGDWAGSRINGSLYRHPLESDGNVLFYRKDWLDSLGITPPTTFFELKRIAQRVQSEKNVDGFIYSGRQGEELTAHFLEALWGCGGRWLFSDETGGWSLGIPSPEGDSALEYLRSTTRGSGAITPPAVMGFSPEDARDYFKNGNAVFLHSGIHSYSHLQNEDSPVRGKIGILPVPSMAGFPSVSAMAGIGAGIARESAHPELAWEFIRFLFEPETQKALLQGAGRYPARRDVYSDPNLQSHIPELNAIHSAFLTARAKPMHPKYAQLSDAMQRSVASVLIGAATPSEALQRVTTLILPHLK
jgi:multiple sugar transport system substrate-binding protein